MPNIQPVNINTADPQTAQTLGAVKTKIGMIPNLFATFARAPAALDAYLQFSGTLGGGRLTARQREIVALAVAQENSCQYCLSAHTLLGKGAGLNDADIRQARAGTAGNAIDGAIAAFARKVVQTKAQLAAADLQAVRDAGVDDGLIVEIIANIALNILTNYTNHIAATDIDFPLVSVAL